MSKRKETPDILADLMGQKKPVKDSPIGEPKINDTSSRKTKKERLAGRATYDLSPELKEAIADRATQLGLPASQLAHFLLLNAWHAMERGELDPEPYLQPSSSPAFRHVIDTFKVIEDASGGSV